MNADYPAAHSMDTVWFAVDGAGHVAVCWSSENGHVPDGGTNDITYHFHQDEDDYLNWEDLARQFDLFLYDYEDNYGGPDALMPYQRALAPEHPLHVHQLPAALRREVQRVPFAPLNFAEAERLQPMEFYPCSYWYAYRHFLASDGVTLVEIPRKETT